MPAPGRENYFAVISELRRRIDRLERSYEPAGGGGGGSGDATSLVGHTVPSFDTQPSGRGLLWTGSGWAVSDLATQAELDLEATARSNADTIEAAARTTHAGLTTSAHGGIVADADARVTADQVAATASIRTLGMGAQQAAMGQDLYNFLTSWRDLAVGGGIVVAVAGAALTDAVLYYGGVVTLAAASSAFGIYRLNPASFAAITGLTLKIRVVLVVRTNVVAPGVTFTLAVKPVASTNGASNVSPGVATVGTAVASAASASPSAAPASPTTSAPVAVEGSEAAFPAVGAYATTLTTSGTIPANSQTLIRVILQTRWS